MMQEKEIMLSCLNKWSDGLILDKRLESFKSEYDNWIKQVPESYKEVVLLLLSEMHYFSKIKANKVLQELHSQILNQYKITDEDTIYTYIKSPDGEINSSNIYWTEYQMINNLNKHICYDNINVICDEEWKYINNIVFIDDFSGTGKSIIKELKKYLYIIKGKTVYILLVSIMSKAKKKLEVFAHDNDFNIVCLCGECREKAFSQSIFENKQMAHDQYLKFSEQMNIPECLGRDKTQALVALYNNTPNNTLGFIHGKSEQYNPIFPRRMDKRPSWQTMSRNAFTRKNANFNNASNK